MSKSRGGIKRDHQNGREQGFRRPSDDRFLDEHTDVKPVPFDRCQLRLVVRQQQGPNGKLGRSVRFFISTRLRASREYRGMRLQRRSLQY